MKKKILLLALIAVFAGLCVGGTYAYFTISEVERNVITAGNIKVELVEKDAEGNDFEDVDGVLPGSEVAKVVTVENTGDNPCWVRIAVDKAIELKDGVEGEPDTGLLTLDLDTENWTEKDGFYYYKKALEPGKATEPLFTKVAFNGVMGNVYAGCKAIVTVQAQAVQTTHNGSAVEEALGWPED